MTSASPSTKTAAVARISPRRWLAVLAALAVLALAIGWARSVAAADVGKFIVDNIVGPIMMLLIGFVGQLLLIMVEVLINIAQYNSFVDSTPVANGWIIVRDLTNMFFILVLLVMAFGTMLGVETYSYKNRMLPRLLIMAVVINFSRTICGLLIDFGQVIMLTFVNGFQAAAGGNFVQALKITELLEPGNVSGGVTGWDIVIAMLLALVMVIISLGVILIMVTVLIMRIVYLWLLVILSPLAFFMKAVPGGKASGYYAEWWSMFTANIVTGPILAFFLWLALVSVAAGGIDEGFGSPSGGEEVGGSVSKAFEGANIQGFIISIALLLGGVMMAQKAGGAGVGVGKSIAKGIGSGVAKQAYKRSGLQDRVEAFQTVRAQRESKRKEGVSAMAAGGYLGLVPGGGIVSRLQKGRVEKRQENLMRQQTQFSKQAETTRAEAKRLRGLGNVNAADAKDKEAKQFEDRAAAAGKRAATERVSSGGAFSAAQQKREAAQFNLQNAAIEKRRDQFKNKDAKDIADAALDRTSKVNPDEKQAAIIDAMEKKAPGLSGKIGDLREQMQGAGANAAMMERFESMVKKSFVSESLVTDPQTGAKRPMNDDEKKKLADEGKLDVKEMDKDQVKNLASILATSKNAPNYEKAIMDNAGLREAFSSALKEQRDSLSSNADQARLKVAQGEKEMQRLNDAGADDATKAQAKAGLDAEKAALSGLTSSISSMNAAIMRTTSPGTEGGSKALQAAYGASGGMIPEANQADFNKALKGKGGDAMVRNLNVDDVVDAKGQLTKVGQEILDNISQSNLSAAAQSASGEGQEEVLRSLIAAVKQGYSNRPELENFVKTRSFENLQEPPKRAVVEAPAKMERSQLDVNFKKQEEVVNRIEGEVKVMEQQQSATKDQYEYNRLQNEISKLKESAANEKKSLDTIKGKLDELSRPRKP